MNAWLDCQRVCVPSQSMSSWHLQTPLWLSITCAGGTAIKHLALCAGTWLVPTDYGKDRWEGARQIVTVCLFPCWTDHPRQVRHRQWPFAYPAGGSRRRARCGAIDEDIRREVADLPGLGRIEQIGKRFRIGHRSQVVGINRDRERGPNPLGVVHRVPGVLLHGGPDHDQPAWCQHFPGGLEIRYLGPAGWAPGAPE